MNDECCGWLGECHCPSCQEELDHQRQEEYETDNLGNKGGAD